MAVSAAPAPAEEEEEPPPEPEPSQPLPDEEFEGRQALFDTIFEGCEAIDLKEKSRAERKDLDKENTMSLAYGELDMLTVHHLLNKVKLNHGPLFDGKGIFVDLGSGVGKACVAAGLLHPFQKVVGIELLQCLHTIAEGSIQAKYQETTLPEGVPKPEIELIQGDFVADFEKLEGMAPEVTVCLAVSTCYGEAELNAMAAMAKKMPDESIFITFTQGLPDSLVIDLDRRPAQRRAIAVKRALAKRGVEPSTIEIEVDPPVNNPFGWTLVHTEEVQLVWGAATCFIYKKIVIEGLRPEQPTDEEPPVDS